MTIFKKIIDKQIPAQIIYEDEHCLAFRDIQPQAPVHVLLIPKREIANHTLVSMADQQLMGHLMVKAAEIAKSLGLEKNGYRIVMNTKEDGGQSVDHIHFHILGGRKLSWPPG